METLKRIYCLIFGHKWGPWRYSENSILKKGKWSICQRCGFISYRSDSQEYYGPHK